MAILYSGNSQINNNIKGMDTSLRMITLIRSNLPSYTGATVEERIFNLYLTEIFHWLNEACLKG